MQPDRPSDDIVDQARRELVSVGRWMSARGFVPATSGNLSRRVSARHVAITASGCDKGELTPADILIAGLDDPAPPRASAETALHLQLYRDRPAIGAVLHGHSIASTLVSLAHAGTGAVALSGYELLKAFRGVVTHETSVEIPVFSNAQDITALAAAVSQRLAQAPGAVCYLIAGHGAYAWGESIPEARRHFEALDFLLTCQLQRGLP